MKTVFISLLIAASLFAQDFVELKQSNSNKIVVKFVFKNGSVTDPQGKEGLTFLTASLVQQGGTGDLSFSQIQEKIYPWAASYSSSVDKEVSIFTFAVPADFIDQFYPLMSGLLLSPSFSEEDFSRVKSNQQNYVEQVIKASSDEDYSKAALEAFMYEGTPYEHMVEGTISGVKSITLDDVKNHYKKFFTRNNLTVGVAGNYSTDFMIKLQKDLTKLPSNEPKLPSPPKLEMPKGVKVQIVAKDNAFGSAIFTGYPLNLSRANDEFAALMVANSYLGEHRKSYGRLYQQIRETRSMNYGDYTYIEWYEAGGSNMLPPSGVPRGANYFAIWIRPVQIAKQLKAQYEELKDIKIGHAHFALRMALYEIDKLIKNGMSEEDFEATRTFLRSYTKLYQSNTSEQLGYLLDSGFYGREDYIKELDKLLADLTLEDVNNAVKKYLQVDNMNISIVTDRSEAEPLAESLRNNNTSPMSYSNFIKSGLPEEVLKEDDIVADFKINVQSVKIVDSSEMFK